jgi:hypothetical protein
MLVAGTQAFPIDEKTAKQKSQIYETLKHSHPPSPLSPLFLLSNLPNEKFLGVRKGLAAPTY